MSGGGGQVYAPSKAQVGAADATYQGLNNTSAAALGNYVPSVTNQAQNLYSQYSTNPYTAQAQGGTNLAASYGMTGVAPSQALGAQQLAGAGSQLLGGIGQALQTGFSPNNDLYNYNLNRTVDQSNAINSMYGLGQSPYGAGLTDQATQQFNMNWNNQQAQLQNLAASTAGNLANAGQQNLVNASNLGTAGLNTFLQSAQAPYGFYGQNLASDLSALSGQNTAVGGAQDIVSGLANQYLNYMQYGTNAEVQKAQLQNSALGGLGGLFGGLLGLGAAPFTGGTSLIGSILPTGLGSLFGGSSDPYAMVGSQVMEGI